MNINTIFKLFLEFYNVFLLVHLLLILLIILFSFFYIHITSYTNNKYIVFIWQVTLGFLSLSYVLLFLPGIHQNSWYLIYAYLTMLLYVLLYACRKLEVSLGSLVRMYCNVVISNLFILGLYRLGKGLPTPILIENLSVLSIYKYILFLSGALSAFLVYIILKNYFMDHLNKLEILTFPYLKEEIRVFLYTWNEAVYGPICSSLIDLLYTSAIKRQMYFFIHFVLFYLIRILQLIFFFNFVFFHGDLRWNIYLLPFSFLSWLLRFFEYYFNTFLKGTHEYIRACLIVTLKDPLTPLKNSKTYFLSGNDLDFELTPFALKEGFQKDKIDDLVLLATEWLRITHIIHFFSIYESKLVYINKFMLFIRLLSWLAITYFFVFSSDSTFVVLNGKFLIFLRSFHCSSVPRYAPPREAYEIVKAKQRQLERDTQGAYKKGHFGLVDSDKVNEKDQVYFEAGLTHGEGATKNPSKEIHSEMDLLGQPRSQRATFTKKETFIDKECLGKPVENSKEFFAEPQVKEILDKYSFNAKDKTSE